MKIILLAAFVFSFVVANVTAHAADPQVDPTDTAAQTQTKTLPYLIYDNKDHQATSCYSQCRLSPDMQVFILPSERVLKNFNITMPGWRTSPALDRAILAAYRYDLSVQIERNRSAIAAAAAVSAADLAAALPLVWQARIHQQITAAQVRELRSRLGFTAHDLLRLPNEDWLTVARSLHLEDADLFTTDEWQSLYREIENVNQGDEARWGLLTLPGFEPRTFDLDKMKDLLLNSGQFRENFARVRAYAEHSAATNRGPVEKMLCEAIRTRYLIGPDDSTPRYDTFDLNEAIPYLLAHDSNEELAKFAPQFVRMLILKMIPVSRTAMAQMARVLVTGLMPQIRTNANGVADALADAAVTTTNADYNAAEIIEPLLSVFSEQGRLGDKNFRKMIAAHYDEMFKLWQTSFASYYWSRVDWPLRIVQNRLIKATYNQLGDISLLTSKLDIEPDGSSRVRELNDTQLTQLLKFLIDDAASSELKIMRLMIITPVYFSSKAMKRREYPLFMKELAAQLKANIPPGSLAAKNLLEKIKMALPMSASMAAPMLAELEPIFSARGTAEEFETIYLAEIENFLDRLVILEPPVPKEGREQPSAFDNSVAMPFYKIFRRRASPHALYEFAAKERTILRDRQIEGEYANLVLQDFRRLDLSGGPASNKAPPKLTVVKCSDIFKAKAKQKPHSPFR